MRQRGEALLVAVLFVSALVLSVTSVRTINETADEVPHIAAAYSYLHKGDFRLNAEHPPLAKEIAALPLLALDPKFDVSDRSWNYSRAWEVGRKFLYQWNTPERIVFWARVPMIGLFFGLGLLLWQAARRLYGAEAGLVALGVALFTPDLLAHGQLVTNDLAIALCFFAAVWFWTRALALGGWRRGFPAAVACGCAVATKHSASILILVLLCLALLYVAFAERMGDLQAPPLRERLSRVAGLGCATLVLTVLIVWAVYGFRFAISPDLEILVPWEEYATDRWIPRLVLIARQWHLLPEAYLAGLLEGFRMLTVHQGFLLGELYPGGRWYYFPVSFLVKTPLPLLLLLLATVPREKPVMRFASWGLLLPPAVFFLVVMQSEVNIGNRHILPVYPFLIVWGAQCGRVVAELRAQRGAGGHGAIAATNLRQCIGLGLVLLWLAVGTLRVHPNYLSYFNELAGGPAGGARFLGDSNVDWGQNLKGLALYQQTHPEQQLYVCYFGSAEPAYYLPKATLLPCTLEKTEAFAPPPPGATVAISQNLLLGIQLRETPALRQFVEVLRREPPIDRIGYSIFIYRMP